MQVIPSWPFVRSQRGFTLVELMITISVLGILMAIALPDLKSFIVKNRLSSDVNGLIGLITYARSEAITRNQSVVICPKSAGAVITCANDAEWGKYETQIFVDTNGNEQRDAGEELLKTAAATDTSGSIRQINRRSGSTGTAGVIRFGAVGLSLSPPINFEIVAKGDATYEIEFGRVLCIPRTGRTRVTANVSPICP